MSIQSEIDRIAQAKYYIAQAIEDKGVEVPTDARLSNLHSYIGAIQVSAGGIGENLGVFNTKGGVIDTTVAFGTRSFSGLVAVSDAFSVVAVGTRGFSVRASHWVSNVVASSGMEPAEGWLTFQAESGNVRMTWVICPDGSMPDRMFTLYGIG